MIASTNFMRRRANIFVKPAKCLAKESSSGRNINSGQRIADTPAGGLRPRCTAGPVAASAGRWVVLRAVTVPVRIDTRRRGNYNRRVECS